MAKIAIGINNPSHEDWFPKMPFWPCHLPSMETNGSQISSPKYWKPWPNQRHQRSPLIKAWHTCPNAYTYWLGDNPHTCAIPSKYQKYPSWLTSLWLKRNHLLIVPPSLHPSNWKQNNQYNPTIVIILLAFHLL